MKAESTAANRGGCARSGTGSKFRSGSDRPAGGSYELPSGRSTNSAARPVSRYEPVMPRTRDPMLWHPMESRSRPQPVPLNPNVTTPVPPPVPRRPHESCPGRRHHDGRERRRRNLHFDSDGREARRPGPEQESGCQRGQHQRASIQHSCVSLRATADRTLRSNLKSTSHRFSPLNRDTCPTSH